VFGTCCAWMCVRRGVAWGVVISVCLRCLISVVCICLYANNLSSEEDGGLLCDNLGDSVV